MNESDLIARAAGGDTAAFGVLVRQNQSPLRGFLRRLTRADQALADDLAQETFLEAWRKLSQYRGEGSFAGWLTRIAWSERRTLPVRMWLTPSSRTMDAVSFMAIASELVRPMT